MVAIPSLDLDPFDEAFLADPYVHHEGLREAGPVVWLKPIRAYGIARYAEVRAALANHELFCSSRGVGLADFAKEEPFRPPSLLLETDPPLHDRARAIMDRIVSPRAIRELRQGWMQEADTMVASLAKRGRIDAVSDLAEAYPMRVFPDTVGLPQEGRELLLDYATIVFNAFGPHNAVFERANAGKEAVFEWVGWACRRENLAPDGWGSAVYAAADRGESDEEEAARLVRSLLTAGVDTTVNGIAHMILAFARFPDEYRKLRADPHLALRAFEESLRWDSTVQTFFRTTTGDTDIGGFRVPAGSKVLLFLAAANRDPRRWNTPERFDIARQTSGHVGFGFGVHQCLGQMVARLEGELIAAALARHVAAIRLAAPPARRLNNTLHAMASMPIEIEPV
jgi:hypothetical protein